MTTYSLPLDRRAAAGMRSGTDDLHGNSGLQPLDIASEALDRRRIARVTLHHRPTALPPPGRAKQGLPERNTCPSGRIFSFEARIRGILDVPSREPGHHFGRPFLTAYQIAISFAERFPRRPRPHRQTDRRQGNRTVALPRAASRPATLRPNMEWPRGRHRRRRSTRNASEETRVSIQRRQRRVLYGLFLRTFHVPPPRRLTPAQFTARDRALSVPVPVSFPAHEPETCPTRVPSRGPTCPRRREPSHPRAVASVACPGASRVISPMPSSAAMRSPVTA